MNSSMSIYGMLTYKPDLFDNVSFPGGIDKDIAINQIILTCADLELLYPDADFMQQAVTHWAAASAEVFAKMFNTTQIIYNPIWNKDGVIKEEVKTGANSESISSVKGFNSNSWAEHTKGTGTAEGNEVRERTEQGNIGVTTTQQMLKEERDVSQFNIYDFIAENFKERFCLMIY